MKICKICGKTEEEVKFYGNYKTKCSKCVNKEQSKKRAEKAGRVYKPKEELDIPEGFKKCTKCGQILPEDSFYLVNRRGKQARYSRCKECERKIVLDHPNRKEYIDKSNANKAAKRDSDPEYRKYLNDIKKTHAESDIGIISYMLSRAKRRAAEKGVDFDLDTSDIILPTHCPILGIELERGTKDNYEKTYSLDRIDNSLGYVKGNVRVISQLANSMKNSATPEQLKTFSENILKYIDKN